MSDAAAQRPALMVDQLAASWLPAYGHDVVQAPNLTALAAEGVTLRRAYCASPLCAPSRASLLTGRLPSRTGVYDNAAELRASLPTVTHRLRAAGYATALAGKMHFVGPDQLHGFEERLTPDVYPAGLDWTPDWRAPLDERLPWYHTMERSSAGRERRVACSSTTTTRSASRPCASSTTWRAPRRGRSCWSPRSRTRTTPGRSRRAVGALRRRRDRAARRPALPLDGPTRTAGGCARCAGPTTPTSTDAQVRRARHALLGGDPYVDDRVGQLLAALRERASSDETIVVFTADHGEMLGERGLWYKMAFFEGAARVPLLVRAPGRFARAAGWPSRSRCSTSPRRCSSCRAALDAADPALDGTSLVPVAARRPGGAARPVARRVPGRGRGAPLVMVRAAPQVRALPGRPRPAVRPRRRPAGAAQPGAARAEHGVAARLRAEADCRWDLGGLERAVLDSQQVPPLSTTANSRAWRRSTAAPASARRVRHTLVVFQAQAGLAVLLDRFHARDDDAVAAGEEAIELFRTDGFRPLRNRIDPTADLQASAALAAEVLAAVAAERGDADRAATLLGVASRLREEVGHPVAGPPARRCRRRAGSGRARARPRRPSRRL